MQVIRFLPFIFIPLILVLSGCSKAAEKIRCSERDPKTGISVFDRQTFNAGFVNYNGISFSFDSRLGEVAAETRCAITHIGKGVFYDYHPEHPAFVFKGDYADRQKGSFFSKSEIRIYPISEYLKIVGQSPDLKNMVEAGFTHLREALEKKPVSFTYSAPFVAILEGGQLFQAKVKYVTFNKGKGILYLTYFCNDGWSGCQIDNQALSYIFQGLSDDGRHFVYGTFPVKTKFLPLSEKLPDEPACFDPGRRATSAEIEAACERYGQQAGKKLEPLSSTDFDPPLDLFDQLVQSLSISTP